MMNQDRLLIRMAGRAHDAIRACHESRHSGMAQVLDSLTSRLDEVRRARNRLHVCNRRSLHAAADTVAFRLRYALYDLQSDIQLALRKIDETRNGKGSPSCRDMLGEIEALKEEFGDVAYNGEERYLAVTTEPIVLEGIVLGPFEIRLLLDHLGERDCGRALRAVALEPNPAAANQSVTHPHVNDESVCLGNAHAAVHTAITEGRLSDVFQLVNSVLNTYNAESPYVALDKWDGRTCYDCGYGISEDDSFWCEGCERDFCDECYMCCIVCSTSYCKGCMTQCPLCDDLACSGCMTTCTECGQESCSGCLDEGLCPTCVENQDSSFALFQRVLRTARR